MTTEFERVKRSIQGRSVMLTSWHDEGTQSWHASAPAYAYLRDISASAGRMCTSRQAAMDEVAAALEAYLLQLEASAAGV